MSHESETTHLLLKIIQSQLCNMPGFTAVEKVIVSRPGFPLGEGISLRRESGTEVFVLVVSPYDAGTTVQVDIKRVRLGPESS